MIVSRAAKTDVPKRPSRDDGSRAGDHRPAPVGGIRNAMSVDVEDFFQVQAFAGTLKRDDWDRLPSRIERNLDLVLRMFADHGVHATFFTLGWIADRHPHLVRRIVGEGHELASHGYDHQPIFAQTPAQFREDVRRAKRLLEDIGGSPVKGYRAPTFSLNAKSSWAVDILAEEGHAYSSSIYPIRHDLYGMPNAPRFAHRPRGDEFVELPMTTVAVFGQNLPCSGGGYFRLFPYAVSAWALRRVHHLDRQPCIFYFHPWEVDPDQPRVPGIPWKSRLRHYVNLGRTEARLRRLLNDFAWSRIDRVFFGDSGACDF